MDRERLSAVLDDPSLVDDDMELHHGGGPEEETAGGRHDVVSRERTADGTVDRTDDGTGPADGTAGGDRTREPATRT